MLLTTVVVYFVNKSESSALYYSKTTVNATVGDTVQLPCYGKTATNTFNWNFNRPESDWPEKVVINGHVVDSFVGRYRLLSRSNVDYSLEISAVRLNESGGYICSENNVSDHST
jgi:hypothetical protein